MNVVVLTGSPRGDKSSSSYLAERFIAGAEQAGNTVQRFDTADMQIHPCTGCNECRNGKTPCIFNDDMMQIYKAVEEADVVAYSTPLYYHAPSPQLLTAISRFHGINELIRGHGKKVFLFVTGANPDPTYMYGIKAWFATDARYMEWERVDNIFAYGVESREHVAKMGCSKDAFEMGASLKD